MLSLTSYMSHPEGNKLSADLHMLYIRKFACSRTHSRHDGNGSQLFETDVQRTQ